MKTEIYGLDSDVVKNLCEAYKDGRLVVLPCKVRELREMLNDLLTVGDADAAETYTTGYRNGYRNSRIELLRYILSEPDPTLTPEEAEAALKEGNDERD